MFKKLNLMSLYQSILVVSIFLLGGLILGLIQSFGLWNMTGNSSFTLNAYKELNFYEKFKKKHLFPSRVSLVSTIASGFAATLLLLTVYYQGRYISDLRRIIQIPILVPYCLGLHILLIYLLMQSSLNSSIAYSMGITKNRKNVLDDEIGSK